MTIFNIYFSTVAMIRTDIDVATKDIVSFVDTSGRQEDSDRNGAANTSHCQKTREYRNLLNKVSYAKCTPGIMLYRDNSEQCECLS
jgi:hypothetical protein